MFKNFNINSFAKILDNDFSDFNWYSFEQSITNLANTVAINSSVKSTDTGMELTVEVPGFDSNTVTVSVENSFLIVRTIKNSSHNSDPKTIVNMYLSSVYDHNNISAEVKNGLLTILIPTLPKNNTESKIKVNVK